MNAHGPDVASYKKAVAADLAPVKIADTMAFMFETRNIIRPTRWALETGLLQDDYDRAWSGFEKGNPA
jgi:homogentisate 1,2-dioxygenase